MPEDLGNFGACRCFVCAYAKHQQVQESAKAQPRQKKNGFALFKYDKYERIFKQKKNE